MLLRTIQVYGRVFFNIASVITAVTYLEVNLTGATNELNAHIGSPV